MEQLKIYGAYAEGFMCHGTVDINPQKPRLCTFFIMCTPPPGRNLL